MLKAIQRSIHSLYLLLVLSSLAFISGSVLSSSTVSADDSVVDRVNITVPTSCSMTGTGMNTHNAEIINGTYVQNIGTTTLHTFCNDNNGFAIYAAGYTGNEIGETNSNKLVGTNATNNLTIDTGLATSAGNPDVSNWAMKLAITQDSGDTTGTNAFTIDSAPNTSGGADASFTQYHVVPNEYTKVAHKNSATDMTTTTGGVKLTTTYAAYVSKTQPADTYTGQVIYTLVHPSDHATPVANPAILDTGKNVNIKLRTLAEYGDEGEEEEEDYIIPYFNPGAEPEAYDYLIKSISVHLETPAPAGFVPSERNTISTPDSKKPIYIVFDNTDDVGIMHLYTEGEQIFLPADSSYMFYTFAKVEDLSDIADWDSSNVTDMSYMFYDAGREADTFVLDLSSWSTSNVTDMSNMFRDAGNDATTFTLNLSSWNTSSVASTQNMFMDAGNDATTFTLNLSSWNASNITDMGYMFSGAGRSATTWSITGLSTWNTSSVTNMSHMFSGAGSSATTFTLDLSPWDTSSVTDMSYMFGWAGSSATTFTLDLSSWDTSSVTDMSNIFYAAGYSATTWSINGISAWNTASVTKMRNMFYDAGYSATTFNLDLSSWDTSNVTDMYYMFRNAGYSATTFSLDLSSWDTSSVTNMTSMFSYAGSSATTWSVTIPPTNGNSINNTNIRMYGKTSSNYAASPSGKSFTLAQP